MHDDLRTALDEAAASSHLLVGVDFDGTLAPFSEEPMEAAALPGAIRALQQLAAMPGMTVALVSGRALEPLRALSAAESPIVLIGSHGAESSRAETPHQLSDEEQQRLHALEGDLSDLLEQHPRARVEHKPSARVLHTRGLSAADATAATDAAADLAERHTGVLVTPGKEVLEMAVTQASKGSALLDLAGEVGAETIVYAGDDVTDERAFELLREHDVGIKVGDGATTAGHRVADEREVLEVLHHLLAARTDGVGSAGAVRPAG